MSEARPFGLESDDIHAEALQAIFQALDEIDDGSASDRGPETVLIGEGGLSSLGFVTFAVVLEELLQQRGVTVSVMDLAAQDAESSTADRLAARIAEAVGAHAP